MSTPTSKALAPGRLCDLGAAFGMAVSAVDGLDAQAVGSAVAAALTPMRHGAGPAFIEARSVRLRSHSTTARETRTRADLEALWASCPIARLTDRLDLPATALAGLKAEAEAQAAAALAFADASAGPDPREVLDHVG